MTTGTSAVVYRALSLGAGAQSSVLALLLSRSDGRLGKSGLREKPRPFRIGHHVAHRRNLPKLRHNHDHGGLTCLGIVDTPRSSIFYRYRRCVYEWSRNFTSEKAV